MSDATQTPNRLYFAVWRWHFYAGLYVIPFLIMLAATGMTMLWIAFLTGIGDEKLTIPQGDQPLPVSQLIAVAEGALPGASATLYVSPLSPGHIAAVAVAAGDTTTGVTLNPYTGEVLNRFPWRAGWYDWLTDIHGSLLIGTLGDRLVEAAASLGLLLVATGIYLHWPREGWGKALTVRTAARGRAFWKSLHGALGLWISLLLVVFLISGLSWAGIWGEKFVQAWSTFPAEKWDAVPLSDATHASMNHGAAKEVPWGLEQTPMPMSGSLAGTMAIDGPVTVDSVAGFADRLGFVGRYQLNLPADDTGVFTISHDSNSNDGPDPTADRTIHIDQYTGHVLADVRYADYSPYARLMAWGVAFHEGDLGLWNLALNTAFCLSVIGMAVSGLVLWWKRRPAGTRLGAPPRPAEIPYGKGVLLVTLGLSLAFPMLGLVLLGVILLDLVVLTALPPLKRLVN